MTAANGFVWFLPVYVTLKLNEEKIRSNNVSCTEDELRQVMLNQFSLSYATVSNNDASLLPSNETVGEWKRNYMEMRNIASISPSDYAPYVYDAAWVFAKTLLQLIKESMYRYLVHKRSLNNKLSLFIAHLRIHRQSQERDNKVLVFEKFRQRRNDGEAGRNN
jgi:hypothetical protein